MQEEIWQAAARSIISIIVLFGFTRLSGKKQISQLSFFHYVIGISIGSIAAAYAVDKELEFTGFLVSMIIYGVFPLILSQMNIKNYIVQKRAEHINELRYKINERFNDINLESLEQVANSKSESNNSILQNTNEFGNYNVFYIRREDLLQFEIKEGVVIGETIIGTLNI